MTSADPSSSRDQRSELVFALVGAAGTRLDKLSLALKSELKTFGYQPVDIHLSDLLENFSGWKDQTGTTEFDRIRHRQDMGNAFRTQFKNGDALARAGIAEIRAERARLSKTKSPDDPAPAHAYILHQLKHPAEVDLLRRVYGPSFFLIAGHAPRVLRVKDLGEQMAQKEGHPGKGFEFEGDARKVISHDEKEEDDFGQNVRDTYPKADFFADLGASKLRTSREWEVARFVDLLFGHPFRTPNPDEYAMYLASAVSLRSSDYNRQVGAVIVSLIREVVVSFPRDVNPSDDNRKGRITNADVIAVGMNEVPRGGGGFYWDQESPDNRDQGLLLQRKGDRAYDIKVSTLAELIERIAHQQWLKETVSAKAIDLARELLPKLKGTQFLNIGEFSRPVHAEMAAIIDAARRGVAVDGHSIYVTTFPCHNCAKHIIAAGLQRVVYLEPYPKSRAEFLHGEEITLETLPGEEETGKVAFSAFTGVAPRQYRQLFSMSERGAKKGILVTEWDADRLSLAPLYVPQNASLLYLDAERKVLENLPRDIYDRDKTSMVVQVPAPSA
jgi:cytidine deaminase